MSTLESLIRAKGLELKVLNHDLHCAVNRYQITLDEFEMTDLNRDQLIIYLILTRSEPGDPLWLKVEEHLGAKLIA